MMESMLRGLAFLVLLAALVAGGLYVAAGRSAPPALVIDKPARVIGQRGEVQITAGAPRGRLTSLTIALEQAGKTVPLFALDAPQGATVRQVDADHIRITRPFGKQQVPELQAGSARIVVSAQRKSFL